jgi:hypothetical protein
VVALAVVIPIRIKIKEIKAQDRMPLLLPEKGGRNGIQEPSEVLSPKLLSFGTKRLFPTTNTGRSSVKPRWMSLWPLAWRIDSTFGIPPIAATMPYEGFAKTHVERRRADVS